MILRSEQISKEPRNSSSRQQRSTTCDFDITEPQLWPPNLPYSPSALFKSNPISSSILSRRQSRAELERVDEDGTRTLDWGSEHQRPPLREPTLVCRSLRIFLLSRR